MRNTFKRFSVIAGFAVLLVLLIGNGLMTRRQVGMQIATERSVADSRHMLLELEKTESLLKDAETSQRGFLYTGDPRYLVPYKHAKAAMDAQFEGLMRLTAGDPQKQSYVVELQALAAVKMSESAQTLDLYQSGHSDDARALVMSNYGLLTMERFRQVIDRLEKEEAALEADRNVQYQKTVGRTIRSIYLASMLATVGLVTLAYYILREMSMRERHSEEMRESEEWFRTTLTSIGDAVIVTDNIGRVSFLNPVAEALTGTSLERARNRDITEVFSISNEVTGEVTEDPVKRVVREGRVVDLASHTVLRHADGHLIPVEDSAAPIRNDKGRLIGVVLVFRDVTQERKSQELMRKSEKLAAAARLAATVAHEINNPLEAVGNLIYIAKSSPGISAESAQHLSMAEQELERVAHITRQTLGFYRESNEAEPIDVPALIDSVLRLYSNKLESKNVRVVRNFRECPPLVGVAGELKQVVSNLVSNAVDAVDAYGTIRIRLTPAEDGNGNTVQLAIEDDGPGISPENVDRIFEPFFTTKKDVGTGLGLWVTKEIIERHGGTISVGTRNGNANAGASFVIDLPCQPARAAEVPVSRPVA